MIQKIDEQTYSLLKRSLDASAERSRVIANNIANVNTPGFKASKVIFEDKLKEAMSGDSLGLKTTNDKHITDGSSNPSDVNYDVVQDNSTSMKTDGNNVDIDGEMSSMATNNILYNTLISQANTRISMRRMVIDGR